MVPQSLRLHCQQCVTGTSRAAKKWNHTSKRLAAREHSTLEFWGEPKNLGIFESHVADQALVTHGAHQAADLSSELRRRIKREHSLGALRYMAAGLYFQIRVRCSVWSTTGM